MPSEPTSAPGRAPSGGIWLPPPEPGRRAAETFVLEHLTGLLERRGRTGSLSSPTVRGGQQAADTALAGFVVAGYRAGRRDAYPQSRRSSSALSVHVRHGLLTLQRLWEHVAEGPADDVVAFRRALLHQEYARHWYARLGGRTARLGPAPVGDPVRESGWDRRMGCVELALDELEEDGWLVGETRRWLACHWRPAGRHWHEGHDHLYRHLLDGSRAAGRLGWLMAIGGQEPLASTASRWDVERHAPGLCATCELVHACPIEDTTARIDRELGLTAPDPGHPARRASDHPPEPDAVAAPSPARADGASGPPRRRPSGTGGSSDRPEDPLLLTDPEPALTAGPVAPVTTGRPEAVWLTAESLGDDDPALVAHPDLPAVFVLDEPLLRRLRLSAKRLVYLVETLADLHRRRPVQLALGEPTALLDGRPLAATFTPVPGWRRRSTRLDVVSLHPWPWLLRPHGGAITSYLDWSADVELHREQNPNPPA